jgi:REP element-mobilizing transposase RayT
VPQSLSAVYLHAIFSTRDRVPFLEDMEVREHMHATLAHVSEMVGCPAVQIGGVSDHVHVLAGFSRSVCPSDWIKEMKRQSSLWVKERYPGLRSFGWQSGYGVFSVGSLGLESVSSYIENQQGHHQTVSFQDEFRAILTVNGVKFDERHLWS